MTATDINRLNLQSEIFKALGHPMRLALLEKLKEAPRCVCDLASDLGLSKSIASKHLSLLREVGLLSVEKRGTTVEYSLVTPCVLDMSRCTFQAVLEHKKGLLS